MTHQALSFFALAASLASFLALAFAAVSRAPSIRATSASSDRSDAKRSSRASASAGSGSPGPVPACAPAGLSSAATKSRVEAAS